MRGHLIVIEGTDCSGKATQTKLLVNRLRGDGYKVGVISYPVYDSPTGKIIGACLLGKPDMCNDFLKEEHGWFLEGGGNVDAWAASDLYAADRRYNLPKLLDLLNNNDIVIADRYVQSNMAHRGGYIDSYYDRLKMYKNIELLEYVVNGLPKPTHTYLLYMPYDVAKVLRENRMEALDEAESNEMYMRRAEQAYLELARIYKYDIVNCSYNNSIRSIDDINNELYGKVKKRILVLHE